MKRQFVVPAAVAMMLHALLLFGFRTGHSRAILDPKDPSSPLPPPDAIAIVSPPESDDRIPSPPDGHPDETPPVLPERPVRDVITEIPMEIPATALRLPPSPTARLTGLTGVPDRIGEQLGSMGIGPIGSLQLDNPPRTKLQVAPVYPYEARLAGRPGEVWVAFVVDEAGRVAEPHVVRSNDPVFEAETLRAVAKWRFEPGRKDGRVVRFRMVVPVVFSVNP